jgi:hypothetical protein
MLQREKVGVKRHRLTKLEVCDVTMEELDAIQRIGCNTGLDFNVAICSLEIALSSFFVLLSTRIDSRATYDTFVIFAIVGAALSVIFGIRWFLNRAEFSRLIQRIKDREVGPTDHARRG